MRQTIVAYAGRHDDADRFDIRFSYPDAAPDDAGATPSQRASVASFYDFDLPDDATDGQAHALLGYRDYARAAAGRLFPNLYGANLTAMARFLAAFVSQDDDRAAGVVAWLDRRWEDGADPDDLARAIGQTDAWVAVGQFATDVVADIGEAGARMGI